MRAVVLSPRGGTIHYGLRTRRPADVPWIVCVNLFHGVATHELSEVRDALALPAHVPLIAADIRDGRKVARAPLTVVDHAAKQAIG